MVNFFNIIENNAPIIPLDKMNIPYFREGHLSEVH